MRTHRLAALALWTVALAAFAGPASAQTPEEVEAAIREQWRRDAQFPPIADLVLHWRHENTSAAALISLFTGVYALHLAIGEAPNCGAWGSSAPSRTPGTTPSIAATT